MKRWFWNDDRLGWPLVVFVLYVSGFVLISDFCWRTLTLSFESLVMVMGLLFVVGAAVIIFGARLLAGRSS
jgi:hypothetical protein